MSSSNKESSASSVSSTLLQQDLLETTQKVEASLQQAILEHISSSEFSPSQGLDFLNVKNSILLSYLIELVYDFRNRLLVVQGRGNDRHGRRDDASLHRLIVMRTVLDKMRGLDKKLRYQIDKLLAAGINSSTFATSASTENNQQQQQQEEDPLQFRPDAAAMEQRANGDDSSSSDDGDDNEQEDGDHDDDDDDDDDLKAARRTVAMAREKRSHKSKQEDEQEEGEEDSKVYRAPRLAAVPYTQDREDTLAQREKRRLSRMRASELAQTLRAQYGDQPEQEDIRGGGSDFGRQREAARRMAEREAEKTQFEEATFVRLTTTRKEKKERQRLLRDESSNLGAIANLDNLIRDTQTYNSGSRNSRNSGGDDDDRQDRKRAAAALAMADASTFDDDANNRHGNGKRKRHMFNADGKAMEKKGRKSLEAKNSLQAALFGGGGGHGGKQSKKKKRNSY